LIILAFEGAMGPGTIAPAGARPHHTIVLAAKIRKQMVIPKSY